MVTRDSPPLQDPRPSICDAAPLTHDFPSLCRKVESVASVDFDLQITLDTLLKCHFGQNKTLGPHPPHHKGNGRESITYFGSLLT